MPDASVSPSTTTPVTTGQVNWRLRFAVEALRQAMSGPTPVRASSSNPIGTLTLLKNGGPTVIFVPRTASDRMGNSVPHKTEKATPTKSRLLNRNAASRLTKDSRFTSASSRSQRVYSRVKESAAAATRNTRKKYPTFDWVKL